SAARRPGGRQVRQGWKAAERVRDGECHRLPNRERSVGRRNLELARPEGHAEEIGREVPLDARASRETPTHAPTASRKSDEKLPRFGGSLEGSLTSFGVDYPSGSEKVAMKRFLAGFALLACSACSGGSTGSTPTTPSTPPLPPTSETFTGTVPVGGSDSHSF